MFDRPNSGDFKRKKLIRQFPLLYFKRNQWICLIDQTLAISKEKNWLGSFHYSTLKEINEYVW